MFPRVIDLTKDELFVATIGFYGDTHHVDVTFGPDYPDTELKRRMQRANTGLFTIAITDYRYMDNGDYYLDLFYNNVKASFRGRAAPMDYATDEERQWFSRLGYALLCKLLARFDSTKNIRLKAGDEGVMPYYEWMGFQRVDHPTDRRIMSASIRVLQQRCGQLAKDVSDKVRFVIDLSSMDEVL